MKFFIRVRSFQAEPYSVPRRLDTTQLPYPRAFVPRVRARAQVPHPVDGREEGEAWREKVKLREGEPRTEGVVRHAGMRMTCANATVATARKTTATSFFMPIPYALPRAARFFSRAYLLRPACTGRYRTAVQAGTAVPAIAGIDRFAVLTVVRLAGTVGRLSGNRPCANGCRIVVALPRWTPALEGCWGVSRRLRG